MEASIVEAPGSHTVITWEDSRVPLIRNTLHSRVLIDGQWMPTVAPLPGQLNARGEGLISHTNYFGIDCFWLPNPEVFSYNKPTALWRNGKVLTISDLLGPNVDAQQVGAQEIETRTLNVESRHKGKEGTLCLDTLVDRMVDEINRRIITSKPADTNPT